MAPRDQIPLEQLLLQGAQLVVQAKNQARRNELQAQQIQQQQQQFQANMKLREDNLQLQQQRVELEQQRFQQAQQQFKELEPVREAQASKIQSEAKIAKIQAQQLGAQRGVEQAQNAAEKADALRKFGAAVEQTADAGAAIIEQGVNDILGEGTSRSSLITGLLEKRGVAAGSDGVPDLNSIRSFEDLNTRIGNIRTQLAGGQFGQLNIDAPGRTRLSAELDTLREFRASLVDSAREARGVQLESLDVRQEEMLGRLQNRARQSEQRAAAGGATVDSLQGAAANALQGIGPDTEGATSKLRDFVGQGSTAQERERRLAAATNHFRNQGLTAKQIAKLLQTPQDN